MNTSTAENPAQWLFLDLNAFFASCEQQENPALRGQPVIVVQTLADSAVAIAASYAAKAFGVKTGTLVRDARRLCPAVVPVQANHRLYTEYHDLILEAVDTCLPVENVCSIDEMACKLMGTERQVQVARELAVKVKRALREQVGECLTCSIGIAPNVFLGKVGSDLQKPDGLVVITKADLPDILLGLQLQDIYGIGPRGSSGFTTPASSMSPSCGTRRPSSCAGCGAGSTGCCSIRCCTASTSSRPPPGFRKASGISMSSSRNYAPPRARTILRSIS
jgi:DNA polymerase-4